MSPLNLSLEVRGKEVGGLRQEVDLMGGEIPSNFDSGEGHVAWNVGSL